MPFFSDTVAPYCYVSGSTCHFLQFDDCLWWWSPAASTKKPQIAALEATGAVLLDFTQLRANGGQEGSERQAYRYAV